MKIVARSGAAESGMPLQLSLDDSFEYRVRRQRRKTIALHILPDATVEVRAPGWVPRAEIAAFVESRSDWVLDQRRQVLAALARRPRFAEGHRHPYLGEHYPLQLQQGQRVSVTLRDGVIDMTLPDGNNAEAVERALITWYRRLAGDVFEERLFACFERFPDWFQDKYPMPTLKIRRMRRRWGSCSSRGIITLNLWMIRMPVNCIDYIVCHELCHLEVFNHSRHFYRLLEQVVPDWRSLEALIDAHSDHYQG